MAAAHPSPFLAHRHSSQPDRQDPYLRLGTITIFVRDPDRSRRFYLDQLGFCMASNAGPQSGDRSLAVSPPDGTAVLSLVVPRADTEKYKLIGPPTQIAFLTEDVVAKFEKWSKRGV